MNNSSANNHSTRGVLMLTLCAFIWGTAFIAQSVGGDYAEPLTFNCARSVLATVFLFGCCLLFDKAAGKRFTVLGSDDPIYKERLLKGGITCGLFLSLACFFQQLGIMYTTVGKSGFITALYIILVPVLSYIFYRRSVSLLQGLSVFVAAVGMYFICINEGFSINKGDLYTLICAFCFAAQIIAIENIIKNLDGVRLSLIQFMTWHRCQRCADVYFRNTIHEQYYCRLGTYRLRRYHVQRCSLHAADCRSEACQLPCCLHADESGISLRTGKRLAYFGTGYEQP